MNCCQFADAKKISNVVLIFYIAFPSVLNNAIWQFNVKLKNFLCIKV